MLRRCSRSHRQLIYNVAQWESYVVRNQNRFCTPVSAENNGNFLDGIEKGKVEGLGDDASLMS